MANYQKALSWVLSHSADLDLVISNPRWIKSVFPAWTDIHCSIQINGEKFYGWGADRSEDIALCKAVAEAIERAVARGNGVNISNGVAAHLSREAAAKNASSELRERDAFLCHYLTKTPFLEISPWSGDPETEARIKLWSEDQKLNVRFYSLSKRGVLCTINGPNAKFPFGLISGSAVKDDIQSSAEAALIEANRSSSFLLHQTNPPAKLTLEAFSSKSEYSFLDHGKLALDSEYAEKIKYLFVSTEQTNHAKTCDKVSEREASIEIRDICLASLKEIGCPFIVVKAESNELQNLWLGPTVPAFVNFGRLSNFSNHPVGWEDLNLLPHPFD